MFNQRSTYRPPRRQILSLADLRIILHHTPEFHLLNPRFEFNSARPVIGHPPLHVPHVVEWFRRIQSEPEGPKNKAQVDEYRSVPIQMSMGDHVCGRISLPGRNVLTRAYAGRNGSQKK